MGLIVPIWKRKGDVHDPGKYRGITLLSQVGSTETIGEGLGARIMRRVEVRDFDEEQQGFRKGRGTAAGTDGREELGGTYRTVWLWVRRPGESV